MSVHRPHGKMVFPGFDDESMAVVVKYTSPKHQERYISYTSKAGESVKKIWILRSSLIEKFSHNQKEKDFLATNFPDLGITSSGVAEASFSSKELFEFKTRSSSTSSLPLAKPSSGSTDSSISDAMKSMSVSSTSSSDKPAEATKRVSNKQILSTIFLCTEDRSIDESQVELFLNKISDSCSQAGPSLKKINGKADKIARSILIDTKAQKGFLLMTHCKKGTDKLIGKGSYKKTKFAVDMQNAKQKVVAVDRIKDTSNERQMMERMKGKPGIVQLELAGTFDNKDYFVMEYCTEGTLSEVFEKKKLTLEERLSFSIDALEGLKVIHAEGIYHRDIKPDNLLVTKDDKGNLRIKIGDFGLACDATDKEIVQWAAFSAMYTAPEKAKILKDRFPDMRPHQDYVAVTTDKLDVWSMGIVLYVTLNSKHDFLSHMLCPYALNILPFLKNGAAVQQAEIDKQIDDSDVPSQLKPLLKGMLEVCPQKRFSAEQSYKELIKGVEQVHEKEKKDPTIHFTALQNLLKLDQS